MKTKLEKINMLFPAIIIGLMSIVSISAQTDNTKHIEVSAGYSYTHARELFEAPPVANGWNAGVAYKFTNRISAYGEVGQDLGKNEPGGGVKQNGNRMSILGGIRYHFVNNSRVTPFVNAGIGYVRFRVKYQLVGGTVDGAPITGPLIAAGGGVDVALNKSRTIGWRTSGECRRVEKGSVFTNNTFQNTNGTAFRFSTGIVFNF